MRTARRSPVWLAILLLSGALLLPVQASAHADLLQQIRLLDGQISSRSENPTLYLKRANLYRLHGDWEAALANVAKTRLLASAHAETDYDEARIWLDRGDPAKAKALLDSYLRHRPGDSNALVLRARAHMALGHDVRAADDYDQAIARMKAPLPDIFLERARHLRDRLPAETARLLRGLDAGLTRLGPSAPLISLAVEVEVARGLPLAAIPWLDRLPAKLRSLPKWQARRGDLLMQAGRAEAARRIYAEALTTIERLPPAKRNRQAVKSLEIRLRRIVDHG